ncbi:hypothetical protein HPB49_005224 [Dermacentor silvarum]|uniref:Uncharacterized protein n=1 Tax=Dermacentor silvarum TaxID=543639 RepID=A0ACB8CQ10_DERSI|nr:hypothetical protein HPB49_005224 [Dermacentor silvarum]
MVCPPWHNDPAAAHLRHSCGVPSQGSVAWWSRSELSAWPSQDWSRRTVHVPAALFNFSVPQGAAFHLHASRYAVRLYRALAQLLLFPADEADAGEWRRDRGRALRSLLGCFEWDLRQLPTPLRHLVAPDSDASRGSALQQTVAVQMAFRAFQERELRLAGTLRSPSSVDVSASCSDNLAYAWCYKPGYVIQSMHIGFR